jgi:pSer/pThr/pTyr-binding forkhead associated (FHA) protein
MFGELEVIQGRDKGQTFRFGKHPVAIGRGADLGVTGIRLSDPRVSRLHCRLEWQGEQLLVTDAGSVAGTWVNNERLTAPRELQPGDVLFIGETYLEFRWSDSDEKSTVSWRPPTTEES